MRQLLSEYNPKTGRFIKYRIVDTAPTLGNDGKLIKFKMPDNMTDIPIPEGIYVRIFKLKEQKWVEGAPMPEYDEENETAHFDYESDKWVIEPINWYAEQAKFRQQLREVILDEMVEQAIVEKTSKMEKAFFRVLEVLHLYRSKSSDMETEKEKLIACIHETEVKIKAVE